jgi:hypothetical protein
MNADLVTKALVSALLIGGLALTFRWVLKSLMGMVNALIDECRAARDELAAVRVEVAGLRERSSAAVAMARENREAITSMVRCEKCPSQ